MIIPQVSKPRVVILGAGFGGLALAKKLKKLDVQVLVIDKNNYHTFQPLLYQVATAGLEPDAIAYPIRKIFRKQNDIYVRITDATRIDPEARIVETGIGDFSYDYMVMATGASTNYFGLDNIKELSMPMKSVAEALNLRSLILQNFEEALASRDHLEEQTLLNYVIVGGGPTGVELAGALAELKNHVLPTDYPDLDIRKMQIHLIESGPRLLGTMSVDSSETARKSLEDLGVNVWLNTKVKDYDGHRIHTGHKKSLLTKTVIWSAGVKGNKVKGINADYSGRLLVDEFNRVEGYDRIFAIGDVAAMLSDEFPKGHPMVAPVAIQQGDNLGKNLKRQLKGKEMKPFRYRDKGTLATIGRNRAVADIGKLRFKGITAWYVWMLVHLWLLVGFKNKLVALINWTWSYINYDRGTRLIIRPFKRKQKSQEDPLQEDALVL